MSDLTKVLENFCRLDHVRGAMILDSHGFVLEESFNGEQESQALAELVLRAVQVGHSMVEDLGKSPLTQQYIEFGDLQITAEQLSNSYVLVILAESGANLGRVRLEIRKNRASVEAMLT